MEDFSTLKNNFETILANTTNIKIEETQKKIQRCYNVTFVTKNLKIWFLILSKVTTILTALL